VLNVFIEDMKVLENSIAFFLGRMRIEKNYDDLLALAN